MTASPSHAPATAPPARLVALILFQALCTVVFAFDVFGDLGAAGIGGLLDRHLMPELGATVGLVIAILFEVRVLMRLLRQQAIQAQALGVASGALSQVIAGYFRAWNLTPAEEDVAAFTIKGYSIAEIAAFRGSAEGTIKTHLNAIYRKAGVAGRAQLVSVLIEDLMRAPLIDAPPSAAVGDKPRIGA